MDAKTIEQVATAVAAALENGSNAAVKDRGSDSSKKGTKPHKIHEGDCVIHLFLNRKKEDATCSPKFTLERQNDKGKCYSFRMDDFDDLRNLLELGQEWFIGEMDTSEGE